MCTISCGVKSGRAKKWLSLPGDSPRIRDKRQKPLAFRLRYTSQAILPGLLPRSAESTARISRLGRRPILIRVEATLTALALELGMTHFEVISRLNLLRLAPELHERIMALPPTSHRCPINKRTLRYITVIPDFECQQMEFNNLISHPIVGAS